MQEADRVLLDRLVSEGDAEAFSALIDQYANLVYSASRRVLGDDDQAADVAQETFFQFLKNADRITGPVSCWLHRVATRRAIDLVRQNASRRRREETYVSAIHHADEWEDLEPLIDEALAELPEEPREILIRHFLKGETTVKIAADRGLSQPTVSRRISSALQRLRESLRGKGLVVGLPVLGQMLANSAQAAPPALLDSLGKMALTQAAADPGVMAGWMSKPLVNEGLKTTGLTAVAVVLVGGIIWLATLSKSPGRPAEPPREFAGPAEPDPDGEPGRSPNQFAFADLPPLAGVAKDSNDSGLAAPDRDSWDGSGAVESPDGFGAAAGGASAGPPDTGRGSPNQWGRPGASGSGVPGPGRFGGRSGGGGSGSGGDSGVASGGGWGSMGSGGPGFFAPGAGGPSHGPLAGSLPFDPSQTGIPGGPRFRGSPPAAPLPQGVNARISIGGGSGGGGRTSGGGAGISGGGGFGVRGLPPSGMPAGGGGMAGNHGSFPGEPMDHFSYQEFNHTVTITDGNVTETESSYSSDGPR